MYERKTNNFIRTESSLFAKYIDSLALIYFLYKKGRPYVDCINTTVEEVSVIRICHTVGY